ncbi:MAG: hypothetical protein GEU26_13625 [Nitrososphaeraceae archaeon]|nr:hypothetical protein [Nitrososphaeraceae archaeon]
MAKRKQLIKQIDSLVNECSNIIYNLLEIQKLKQNDVRVAFFKHLHNILDPTVLSLIIVDKYLDDSNLEAIHNEYTLSRRLYGYDKERQFFDQIVMNYYFLFTFNVFEHAMRLICAKYNNKLFQEQEKSFNGLCKGMTKDLGLKKRDKFIDLIIYLRNSFHNNGLFVPAGSLKDTEIRWNKTIYYFNKNRPIKESKGDIWLSFVPISQEIITFFNEIISSVPVQKFSYYVDLTEPVG